jgi:hypothetical protein
MSVIPMTGMSTEAQMNALTRLLFAVFLILLLFGFKYSGVFLIFSLVFVIIIYYVTTKKMETFQTKEQFTSAQTNREIRHPQAHHPRETPPPKSFSAEYYTPKSFSAEYYTPKSYPTLEKTDFVKGGGNTLGIRSQAHLWCDDSVQMNFNDPPTSKNQRLVGQANPKTLVNPIIVPPISDLEYWRANNLITHSAINEQSQFDAYQSGYQVSTCCGSLRNKVLVPQQDPLAYAVPLNQGVEMYQRQPTQSPHGDTVIEHFGPRVLTTAPGEWPAPVMPEQPGQMNTACGYNPEQIFTAGLPSNFAAGNCQKDPLMKPYNQNLYNQTVMPGVYQTNQVNEPINSNMGISFTQQWEPTTCKTDMQTGDVFYTEHDPRIVEPAIVEPNAALMTSVDIANIYDPRHTGYGTSYRSYTDDLTGQPKFYYDDIDAVRMPNYITRSNIDFAPFADSYGPAPAGEAFGNEFNSDIHALANDAFLRASLQQRTELTTRLMHKANVRQAQLRQAPIRTNGSASTSGMGSCK